jgi:hypothetical protein
VSDSRHGVNPISMTRHYASWPGAGGEKFTLIRPDSRRWLSRRRPATPNPPRQWTTRIVSMGDRSAVPSIPAQERQGPWLHCRLVSKRP